MVVTVVMVTAIVMVGACTYAPGKRGPYWRYSNTEGASAASRHRLARKQGLQGLRFAPGSVGKRAESPVSARLCGMAATRKVRTFVRTRLAGLHPGERVPSWRRRHTGGASAALRHRLARKQGLQGLRFALGGAGQRAECRVNADVCGIVGKEESANLGAYRVCTRPRENGQGRKLNAGAGLQPIRWLGCRNRPTSLCTPSDASDTGCRNFPRGARTRTRIESYVEMYPIRQTVFIALLHALTVLPFFDHEWSQAPASTDPSTVTESGSLVGRFLQFRRQIVCNPAPALSFRPWPFSCGRVQTCKPGTHRGSHLSHSPAFTHRPALTGLSAR